MTALRKGVDVDIVLGMPKHECRYHGICRLEKRDVVNQVSKTTCCNAATGQLFFPFPAFCLLTVNKESMNKDTMFYQFGREVFAIQEGVSLPSFDAASTDDHWYLKPGYYPIQETEKQFMLLMGMVHRDTAN